MSIIIKITQKDHEFVDFIHEFIFGSTTNHLLHDLPFIIQSIDKMSQLTNCQEKKEFLTNLVIAYKSQAIDFLKANKQHNQELKPNITKETLINLYSKFAYFKVQKEQEILFMLREKFE
ncbi:hypothetical protein SAMN05443634_103203 [Chishuiella changwenlii]|uniref:Uncharacterized protein n=1 Tax=Chishuiella changwenlii TaxID=1434701 RepID=A0A1M6V6B3_9FLAO|nr:hypothetical protein [Chishuiella changwenlii]GGF01726.1 hypothetical protein GCM10010984_18970 [Chishuiella changwenlii]SHK77002.1 hypothetical protein SAMN05443634_103203 [Chishuiella changwenlii]